MVKKEILDETVRSHLNSLPADDMVIFVLAQGRARGAFFSGTRFVNQMRAQHSLGILETMVLGQASVCGALLIPTMKGKEHLTLRYEVSGVAEGFSVEADSTGYVRSYLFTDHIPVEKPLKNWDLAPFLGKGTLTMATVHEGDRRPFTSSVPIAGESIAKDLAYYFSQSEQIQTAFNTSIQMDTKGRVIGAGGFFLQLMPNHGGTVPIAQDDHLIDDLEAAFAALPSLGTWVSEGNNAEQFLSSFFAPFNPQIALHRAVSYDCPCTRERFLLHIRALPVEEIRDIKKEKKAIEVTCRNCGSVYSILPEEI